MSALPCLYMWGGGTAGHDPITATIALREYDAHRAAERIDTEKGVGDGVG